MHTINLVQCLGIYIYLDEHLMWKLQTEQLKSKLSKVEGF